ncbi:DUF2336 domain-containing protein [Rhodospira trueperi]|uniref:DUF2336 domain-containing protein n=1 Tax=Rhodospira trueperi TaxID=69960 RepID=A0A1G6ZAE3_9PROT|nr:DUF2336 domain-containing protein [Rhodospira trueperi]SDD98726.1 hypothetical protein SAMN05421720_102286 [Rhodospira trueperi]
MTDLLRRLFKENSDNTLTYEEARELAAHDDVTVRRTLAHRTDLAPEVLYYLAGDDDAEVRGAIAGNVATPARAYLRLTDDGNEDVRLALVRRITALAPDLSDDERNRAREKVHESLTRLAQDAIPKVRALLAEALKDVAHAPPAVINRLARDAEIAVAAPVLTFSPVLTDADLLSIIENQPASEHLSAIARRPGGLTERVTEAIVGTDDTGAIADMLTNRGAQIREATLDALIDRAAAVPAWHGPLVRRPSLPDDAARRLAVYVSDTLVQALMLREDLTPEDAMAVSREMHRRLEPGADEGDLIDYGPDWRAALQELHAHIVKEIRAGTVGESDIRLAMDNDDRTRAIALLAALADISPMAVVAAVRASSPKGIVSLIWKAGLPASILADLQRWLAAIPPQEILRPDPDTGHFPLEISEMDWQIAMFRDLEETNREEPSGASGC